MAGQAELALDGFAQPRQMSVAADASHKNSIPSMMGPAPVSLTNRDYSVPGRGGQETLRSSPGASESCVGTLGPPRWEAHERKQESPEKALDKE